MQKFEPGFIECFLHAQKRAVYSRLERRQCLTTLHLFYTLLLLPVYLYDGCARRLCRRDCNRSPQAETACELVVSFSLLVSLPPSPSLFLSLSLALSPSLSLPPWCSLSLSLSHPLSVSFLPSVESLRWADPLHPSRHCPTQDLLRHHFPKPAPEGLAALCVSESQSTVTVDILSRLLFPPLLFNTLRGACASNRRPAELIWA